MYGTRFFSYTHCTHTKTQMSFIYIFVTKICILYGAPHSFKSIRFVMPCNKRVVTLLMLKVGNQSHTKDQLIQLFFISCFLLNIVGTKKICYYRFELQLDLNEMLLQYIGLISLSHRLTLSRCMCQHRNCIDDSIMIFQKVPLLYAN